MHVMSTFKLAVAVATLSIVATSAVAAPKITGSWKGKVKVDKTKLPKATNPQMASMMQQQLALYDKMVINLSLSANSSFKLSVSGIKTPQAPPTVGGKWKLAGKVLTLTFTATPQGTPPPQTYTLAKDFKSFQMAAPGGQGYIKFTR